MADNAQTQPEYPDGPHELRVERSDRRLAFTSVIVVACIAFLTIILDFFGDTVFRIDRSIIARSTLQNDIEKLQEQDEKHTEEMGKIRKDLQEQGEKRAEEMEKIRAEALAQALRQSIEQTIVKTLGASKHAPLNTESCVILAINDVYRIEGVDEGKHGGLAKVRRLRVELEQESPDLLLLHAGDFLFPSLLSGLYNGQQMVDILNLLDGDLTAYDPRLLVTFGNHEFDKDKLPDASMLNKRIEESQFRWLGSNIEFASSANGRSLVEADNLVDSLLIECGGVQVGVFGLTTDIKKPAYVVHFTQPERTARVMTALLHGQGAQVVVALSHLPISQDTALLRNLGSEGPDLIIGGHEHNRQAKTVNGRWLIKADAEARTATVVHVTPVASGPPSIRYEFRMLGPEAPGDERVKTQVDEWLVRHEREFCQKRHESDKCLHKELGKTNVRLIGEELEIRKYETNLGNWIADQARAAFEDDKAQIAFINSGSLRLNQDIPAETLITRRHVEELFPYEMPLKLLKITGATLQEVVSHAVTDWTGNGRWLQISGFAYCHNPDATTAGCLTLLAPEGPRRIDPKEELLVVTNDFLVNPDKGDQDGYTMLPHQVQDPKSPNLRQLVIKALELSREQGIAPEVEGRICNSRRDEKCQAMRDGSK
jgi:2',3'-cyclic-nucleotide 2'-phosphodiesterase (5'-nucleotidase family)